MISFTIPRKLPDLNDHIRACNSNRHQGNKLKSETEELIFWCIKNQISNFKTENPISICFKWYEPNRKRDKDNIAFAKKYILDAMQTAGTIKGDGWKYIDYFTDEFYVDKEHPRVDVIII